MMFCHFAALYQSRLAFTDIDSSDELSFFLSVLGYLIEVAPVFFWKSYFRIVQKS